MNNFKSLLLAGVLSLATIAPANADIMGIKLSADRSGIVYPVYTVTHHYDSFSNNAAAVEHMKEKGILGFRWERLFMGEYVEGAGGTGKIRGGWSIMYYQSKYPIYDGTVFAVNNEDGTATVYEPGDRIR